MGETCGRSVYTDSVERRSFTWAQVRVWTKWNSLRLNPILTTSYPNTSSIKMLLLTKTICQASLEARKKKNLMKNKSLQNFQRRCCIEGILTVTYCSVFQMPIVNSKWCLRLPIYNLLTFFGD